MLTITIPKVMSFSSGMKILDLIPTGYSPDYVNSLMGALDEEGRYAYLYNQIPLDMVYPLLFAISWCLIFVYFLQKAGIKESILFYLSFLPLLAGFFDYCENFGIISIITQYPDNPIILSQITNVFSILKSFLSTIYYISLILLLVVIGIRYISAKVKT